MQARNDGLPQSAIVRTSSPSLALGDLPTAVPLFKNVPRARQWQYMASSQELTREVFSQFQQSATLSEYSLLIARSVYGVHRKLHKLLALTEADFRESRLAITIDTGDESANARLNPPWAKFLCSNPFFDEVVYKVDPLKMTRDRAPFQFRLRSILSYQRDEILWRAMHLVGHYLNRFKNRSALIVVGSHLVRDVAGYLTLGDYRVKQFCQTPKELREIIFSGELPFAPEELVAQALENINGIFDDFLKTWFCSESHSSAKELLLDEVSLDLAEFYTARQKWRDILSKESYSVILTRCPIAPVFVALGQAARDLGIPTVAAQHGVGREIDAINPVRGVLLDNGVVDYFLTYNSEARKVDEASPYRRGISLPIGLSADYFRATKPVRYNRKYPAIFVSTALLAGQVNTLKGSWGDIDRVQFELQLIGNVFAQLNYGVIYKQYPSTVRYPDPELTQAAISQITNVKFFGHPVELVDMRLTQYQIIICARATSSLAWCLMANRPLVIIDIPQESPLRTDVTQQLADAVFLFHEDDPDFFANLTEFLSRPFAEIHAEWRAKAPERAAFLEHFISGEGPGAGKRGASLLGTILTEPLAGHYD